MVLAHLIVGVAHGYTCQSLQQSSGKVRRGVLLVKGILRACVDTIEMHVVLTHHRAAGLEEAASRLIVQRLQEQCLDVHVALLLLCQHVVKLTIELADMQ